MKYLLYLGEGERCGGTGRSHPEAAVRTGQLAAEMDRPSKCLNSIRSVMGYITACILRGEAVGKDNPPQILLVNHTKEVI